MRKKNNSTKGDKFADFMDFNKPHMNDQRLIFFFRSFFARISICDLMAVKHSLENGQENRKENRQPTAFGNDLITVNSDMPTNNSN